MKHYVPLTVLSLFSVLLFTFHLADDIVRGIEPGDASNLSAILIFGVWLYATLALEGRRSGYIIVLLASLLSLCVPVLHTMGKGVGVAGPIAKSSGAFFFIWTLYALGVSAFVSVMLSVRGLWSLRRSQER
ncbi:MAG TPA: hypothetical protein VNI54_12230 [Thermoanaerobaculia bacterium]|nr:hypothetical protein [Thermoanaerobaculia bacterium]